MHSHSAPGKLSGVKEMLLYMAFGVGTTLINVGAYWLFNTLWGAHLYLVSNIGAWVFSVIFAFVTNKVWVFQSRSWQRQIVIREGLEFFGARLLSFVIEEFGLYIMIDLCGLGTNIYAISNLVFKGETLAKVLMSVVVILMNYFFSKFVIFKKSEKSN